jgi:hypothetical protein
MVRRGAGLGSLPPGGVAGRMTLLPGARETGGGLPVLEAGFFPGIGIR